MDEQQFILRLPEPLVERMRFALSSTKKRENAGDERKPSTFSVNFHDSRDATFTVDGVGYPASLMDLPTLVETHKTADKRTFYKSGDLHQVLVVRLPHEPKPDSYMLQDGLTPAARDAGRRLAPPKNLFSQAQVESVEHRVKYVIDHKVKIVPKKDRPTAPAEDELVEIEEETTDNVAASAEKPTDVPQASKPATPMPVTSMPSTPMDKPAQANGKEADVNEALATPATEAVVAATPGPDLSAPSPTVDVQSSPVPTTPAVMTPGVMTPSIMTPGAMTPMPDADGEDDDEEVDDEFVEMAGALMEEDEEEEARKRIERVSLDQKIAEQKVKIQQIEERAAKAPNHVLRQRMLGKKGELEKALAELEASLAALGD